MSINKELVKLNFGGGSKRIEGFENVDALDWNGITDMIWDLTEVPYVFIKEPVNEIIAMELLEHISWRDTEKVLKEWYRILEIGGKISIQVPACDKMMEMYINKEICDCVKHKPLCDEDTKGKENCWMCQGKGKVNPTRWLMAFCGAQKHEYDKHLNIFTKEILEKNLTEAGFSKIEIKYDKYNWKLIATAFK